jgi:hypothetical protein
MTCKHCEREITLLHGMWVDEQADGDDLIWRDVCDRNDTFQAPHEV